MLPETCVVVPTYWTRAGAESRPGDAVYDHPTPVDGSSTLPPLLESLALFDTSTFYLLILIAVTGPDVTVDAEARVRELVSGHSSLPTLLFGPSQLDTLHRRLRDGRVSEAASFLNLQGYPRIRNLQLAVPLCLRSAAIVALDDDEIVTDPLFLRKAVEPLGTRVDGAVVDGLSGHYIQENGSILLEVDPAKAASPNLFDRKAVIMNAATEKLEAEPGNIVETPFCFGGNMEFTADLAASVGFDPGITRGEDIDYLINARLEGRRFFLRKDLRILHRPPRGGSYKDVSRSKLEQDIIRFVYEREKLEASQTAAGLQALSAENLMPYPGDFLNPGVDDDAVAALEAAAYQGDARRFVGEVRADARNRVRRYLHFRAEWPRVMQALADDSQLFDMLAREVRGV